ncbi:MAG: hypothetical protein Q8O92_10320 [Candidatus Latescibacter sp.]|nr:hypothetical protein [Candidatus Latescibacter sp.]
MSKLILLDIELSAIESFLKNIKCSAELEYSKINERSNKNEFNHYDDEANAYFIPMQWKEIAIRASLCELNALVEWELWCLASEAYHNTKNIKPNKTIFDLKINQIVELIENYYKIKLGEIDYFNNIFRMRNKVNSFKHRKGFKNPFKEDCNSLPEKHEISYQETFQSIKDVRISFINLWKKI